MGLNLQNLSVLIVDDLLPLLDILRDALHAIGVGRVLIASNVDTAFNVFCEHKPDIVITDWHMPGGNGTQLIKMIRTNPASPDKLVPIIMMTGYSAKDRVITARDSGINEFLVKPFSANELAHRISHIINKPRPFVKAPDFVGPDRRRIAGKSYEGPMRRERDQSSGANPEKQGIDIAWA